MSEGKSASDYPATVGTILADMERTPLADFTRLLLRRYPPVTYGIEDPAYLPIFVFHTLTEADLFPKLQFLQANGYRTICLDDAAAWMSGAGKLPPKPVVLTIDDGRLSTWSVAAPLLEKFGMQAIAYVIAGYVEDGPARPTLRDVWAGRIERAAVESSEREDSGTMMRWSEIAALQSGGVIEIGSHSMLHRRLFVAPDVTAFLRPDSTRALYDVPKWPDDRQPWTPSRLGESAGSPLFSSRPLLSITRAWVGGRRCQEACLAEVRKHGADAFFSRSDWSRRLRSVVRECASGSGSDQWEEVKAEKEWELLSSRQLLEDRLGIDRIGHFCYPSAAGGADTVDLTRRAGYRTSAWGLLDHRLTNRQGSDPQLLSRIKHDFILTLPGDGRQSLFRVLKSKVERRRRGDTGY